MVKRRLMIVIKRQRSMSLGQRKVWVLAMNFLRTPTMGKMIHRYLDHLDMGIVYPGPAFIVQANASGPLARRRRRTFFRGLAFGQ